MLTKTSLLENQIIQDIVLGRYAPGRPIPSRNRLADRYNCSRTTVERAITSLTQSGYLASKKGSGTYVLTDSPKREIRSVCVVSGSDVRRPEDSFSELLFNEETLGLPVGWVATARTTENFEILSAPNRAIIWLMPGLDQLMLIDRLASKSIPQLLINREYRNYDGVFTDAPGSIREGLAWLLIEAGRDIAFITRPASVERPYLAGRTIAFYEQAIELGAHLSADTIVSRNFNDIPREIAEIGVRLFGGGTPPRGIFVLERDLALPLVICAQGYGLTVGKDYKLLTFDFIPELEAYRGVGMMRQPFRLFRREIQRWLSSGAALAPERFSSALKTELLLYN